MPTSALSRKMSRTLLQRLVHRYVRTPVSGGSEDAWGDEAASEGTATSGVRCLYTTRDQFVRDDIGARTVSTPILYVAPTDPLAVGDRVSSVTDQAGTVLLAGPLDVESINVNAETGTGVLKAAILRGAVERRSES